MFRVLVPSVGTHTRVHSQSVTFFTWRMTTRRARLPERSTVWTVHLGLSLPFWLGAGGPQRRVALDNSADRYPLCCWVSGTLLDCALSSARYSLWQRGLKSCCDDWKRCVLRFTLCFNRKTKRNWRAVRKLRSRNQMVMIKEQKRNRK